MARRNNAYNLLKSSLPLESPKLILSAEVYISKYLFSNSSLDEIKTILKNYKTIKAYAENQKISKEEFEKLVSIIKMAGELEEDYIPPFEKLVTDKYL